MSKERLNPPHTHTHTHTQDIHLKGREEGSKG